MSTAMRDRRTKWIAFSMALCAALTTASSLKGERQNFQHSEIEQNLQIVGPGTTPSRVDMSEALHALHIPSASIALIDNGALAWARAWGGASTETLYQAASLSKVVTAVAAMRLVETGELALDRDVNDDLIGWRVPDNSFTEGHPVTLRGLLSMTAGIGVPGYLGYEVGAPLPSLTDI
jgi:CubicO group peptidase (beta-lactamase class C family)